MRIPYVLLALLVAAGFPCLATSATITIDAGKDLVPVNPLLFGTNLQANDESGEPIKAFIRDVGLTVFRYPDGGGYYYLDRPGDGWGSGKAGLGANDKLAASYLGSFKKGSRGANDEERYPLVVPERIALLCHVERPGQRAYSQFRPR